LEETEARLTQKQRAADQHSLRRYEQFAAYERSHGCRHHNDPHAFRPPLLLVGRPLSR